MKNKCCLICFSGGDLSNLDPSSLRATEEFLLNSSVEIEQSLASCIVVNPDPPSPSVEELVEGAEISWEDEVQDEDQSTSNSKNDITSSQDVDKDVPPPYRKVG